MKKIIFTILTVIAISSLLCVSAFAADSTEEVITEAPTADAATDTGAPDDAPADTAEPDSAATDAESVTTDTDSTAENPFAVIFGAVAAHADEILSALAFIGSMVLAFTYKKGLLPSLSRILGSIGASVKEVSERADTTAVQNESAVRQISERVGEISALFERMSARVDELTATLDDREANRTSNAAMRAIITAQVDMLYDVFMTSSLPQYAKDAVGERIADMKTQLQSIDDGSFNVTVTVE